MSDDDAISQPPVIAPVTERAGEKGAAELQQAFHLFNRVSAELTHAYEALQKRVESLTEELAIANGALRRQFLEKEALSERLSSLLDALPAGVVLLDAAALVVAVNPAALRLFGGHVLGQHWGDVVRAHLAPTVTVGEWLLGGQRLAIAESPLPSGDGKILLVHDITQATQMKADLERNQRMVAMGEMAASLAHQLRTPLATALLYSGNLAQASLPEPARLRFAGKVSEQLQRLERLIQDVLLFAKGERIGKDVFDGSDLLQEAALTMDPLMRAQAVRFSTVDQLQGGKMVGARKALYGALISLLENALQATPEGGEILFSGELDPLGQCVRFRVQDTGPGISPELHSRIFEPFYTTKGQGTGLGLAIALGVARAHGGEIEVSTPAAGGALFTMRLPCLAGVEN